MIGTSFVVGITGSASCCIAGSARETRRLRRLRDDLARDREEDEHRERGHREGVTTQLRVRAVTFAVGGMLTGVTRRAQRAHHELLLLAASPAARRSRTASATA